MQMRADHAGGMVRMTFPWHIYTDRLKALNAEGLSAGRIADALSAESGCECSRNSVIGKLKRLRIALVSGATNQNFRNARKPKPGNIGAALFSGYRPGRQLPAPRENSVAPSTDQAAVTLVPEQPARCTIMDLPPLSGRHGCRWIVGDSRKPLEPIYCGMEREGAGEEHPYCECHARMAYRVA